MAAQQRDANAHSDSYFFFGPSHHSASAFDDAALYEGAAAAARERQQRSRSGSVGGSSGASNVPFSADVAHWESDGLHFWGVPQRPYGTAWEHRPTSPPFYPDSPRRGSATAAVAAVGGGGGRGRPVGAADTSLTSPFGPSVDTRGVSEGSRFAGLSGAGGGGGVGSDWGSAAGGIGSGGGKRSSAAAVAAAPAGGWTWGGRAPAAATDGADSGGNATTDADDATSEGIGGRLARLFSRGKISGANTAAHASSATGDGIGALLPSAGALGGFHLHRFSQNTEANYMPTTTAPSSSSSSTAAAVAADGSALPSSSSTSPLAHSRDHHLNPLYALADHSSSPSLREPCGVRLAEYEQCLADVGAGRGPGGGRGAFAFPTAEFFATELSPESYSAPTASLFPSGTSGLFASSCKQAWERFALCKESLLSAPTAGAAASGGNNGV